MVATILETADITRIRAFDDGTSRQVLDLATDFEKQRDEARNELEKLIRERREVGSITDIPSLEQAMSNLRSAYTSIEVSDYENIDLLREIIKAQNFLLAALKKAQFEYLEQAAKNYREIDRLVVEGKADEVFEEIKELRKNLGALSTMPSIAKFGSALNIIDPATSVFNPELLGRNLTRSRDYRRLIKKSADTFKEVTEPVFIFIENRSKSIGDRIPVPDSDSVATATTFKQEISDTAKDFVRTDVISGLQQRKETEDERSSKLQLEINNKTERLKELNRENSWMITRGWFNFWRGFNDRVLGFRFFYRNDLNEIDRREIEKKDLVSEKRTTDRNRYELEKEITGRQSLSKALETYREESEPTLEDKVEVEVKGSTTPPGLITRSATYVGKVSGDTKMVEVKNNILEERALQRFKQGEFKAALKNMFNEAIVIAKAIEEGRARAPKDAADYAASAITTAAGFVPVPGVEAGVNVLVALAKFAHERQKRIGREATMDATGAASGMSEEEEKEAREKLIDELSDRLAQSYCHVVDGDSPIFHLSHQGLKGFANKLAGEAIQSLSTVDPTKYFNATKAKTRAALPVAKLTPTSAVGQEFEVEDEMPDLSFSDNIDRAEMAKDIVAGVLSKPPTSLLPRPRWFLGGCNLDMEKLSDGEEAEVWTTDDLIGKIGIITSDGQRFIPSDNAEATAGVRVKAGYRLATAEEEQALKTGTLSGYQKFKPATDIYHDKLIVLHSSTSGRTNTGVTFTTTELDALVKKLVAEKKAGKSGKDLDLVVKTETANLGIKVGTSSAGIFSRSRTPEREAFNQYVKPTIYAAVEAYENTLKAKEYQEKNEEIRAKIISDGRSGVKFVVDAVKGKMSGAETGALGEALEAAGELFAIAAPGATAAIQAIAEEAVTKGTTIASQAAAAATEATAAAARTVTEAVTRDDTKADDAANQVRRALNAGQTALASHGSTSEDPKEEEFESVIKKVEIDNNPRNKAELTGLVDRFIEASGGLPHFEKETKSRPGGYGYIRSGRSHIDLPTMKIATEGSDPVKFTLVLDPQGKVADITMEGGNRSGRGWFTSSSKPRELFAGDEESSEIKAKHQDAITEFMKQLSDITKAAQQEAIKHPSVAAKHPSGKTLAGQQVITITSGGSGGRTGP